MQEPFVAARALAIVMGVLMAAAPVSAQGDPQAPGSLRQSSLRLVPYQLDSPHSLAKSNSGQSPHVLAARLGYQVGTALGSGQAGQAIEVTGATHAEFDEASGVWHLRGEPVVATRGSTTVRAPALTYESRSQVVRATGGVTYSDRATTLTAAGIVVWLQEERAVAEGEVVAVLRGVQQETRLSSRHLALSMKDRRALATGAVTLEREKVTITGDSLDYDDRNQRAVVTGNPRVMAAESTLTANRIEAQLDREEFVATGSVRLTHGDLEGQAPKVVLHRRDGIAVLSGGATVRRGRNETSADTVTVDLQQKRIVASGHAHLVIYQADRP